MDLKGFASLCRIWLLWESSTLVRFLGKKSYSFHNFSDFLPWSLLSQSLKTCTWFQLPRVGGRSVLSLKCPCGLTQLRSAAGRVSQNVEKMTYPRDSWHANCSWHCLQGLRISHRVQVWTYPLHVKHFSTVSNRIKWSTVHSFSDQPPPSPPSSPWLALFQI